MAAALRQVFAVTLLLQVISTETTVPPHITICTCDLDARTVTCSWERPSDGNETSYTLTYWEDSFSGVGPVKECDDHEPSSCTFTPSSLFVPYKVVLTRTEGNTGQAVRSFPWEIIPYQSVKPNAPDMTATVEGSRQVTVSWPSSIPPAFRSVVDESACQLQFRENRIVTWQEPEDAGRQKAFTLRGLRPYTEYAIRIRCKAEYWGEFGTPVHVWTLQEAPEGVPTEVEAKTAPVNGSDSRKDVTFSWAEVPLEHQNGPIIRYYLNLTTGGKAISSASVDGNTTGYTFRNLAVNQAYQVVLWAVNAAGASPTVTYDIPGDKAVHPATPHGAYTRVEARPAFQAGSTMVIILGSVLGGLLLLSVVIFVSRRAIVKRFKIVKGHLWPKIPGPENFLAPPSSEEDYYQELDHVPPFVYLPPEPEIVDDIAEERRKLLATLPEGSSGGANSGGSNLYASVRRGSRAVSTATDGVERSGHDASCHGSSKEVAGITTVPNEPVSMSTEGDDALIPNARAINNYVQVDHSSCQVTLATGGAPLVSSGNGTGGSRVMQNYTQVYHRGCPVGMVTKGDNVTSFRLAETTPREVGTTVWMSQPIQDYVQSSSNVAMATAGAHAVSSGAAVRDEKVPRVGKNGELSASQHMNDYVQSTNVQVHKDCPHH